MNGRQFFLITKGLFKLNEIAQIQAQLLTISAIAGEASQSKEWVRGQLHIRGYLQHEPCDWTPRLVSAEIYSLLYSSLWQSTVRGEFLEEDLIDNMLTKLKSQATLQIMIKGGLIYTIRLGNLEVAKNFDMLGGWKWDKETISRRIRGECFARRAKGVTVSKQVGTWLEALQLIYDEKIGFRSRITSQDYVKMKSLEDALPEITLFSKKFGKITTKDVDGNYYGGLTIMIGNMLVGESQLVLMRSGVAIERYRME